VPLPYPTEAEEIGQEEQVELEAAAVGFAEGKAQVEPKDIIAAQIRSQGYACTSTQSAERDMAASVANEAVWILHCQNASYRVTLIPNMAAKVEKLGEEIHKEVHKATDPSTTLAACGLKRQGSSSLIVLPQHRRQLGDVAGDPPRFVPRQHLDVSASACVSRA
jgi:hypothetical protein